LRTGIFLGWRFGFYSLKTSTGGFSSRFARTGTAASKGISSSLRMKRTRGHFRLTFDDGQVSPHSGGRHRPRNLVLTDRAFWNAVPLGKPNLGKSQAVPQAPDPPRHLSAIDRCLIHWEILEIICIGLKHDIAVPRHHCFS
jgi:hypothetical protein